jgi:hypothetical protein
MIKGGDEIRAHTLAERAVRGIETDRRSGLRGQRAVLGKIKTVLVGTVTKPMRKSWPS